LKSPRPPRWETPAPCPAQCPALCPALRPLVEPKRPHLHHEEVARGPVGHALEGEHAHALGEGHQALALDCLHAHLARRNRRGPHTARAAELSTPRGGGKTPGSKTHTHTHMPARQRAGAVRTWVQQPQARQSHPSRTQARSALCARQGSERATSSGVPRPTAGGRDTGGSVAVARLVRSSVCPVHGRGGGAVRGRGFVCVRVCA
jgi:hypothetical protein